MIRTAKSNKFNESLDSSNTFKQSYSKISKNIQVTAWPEFIDSKLSSEGDVFIWSYQIHIENKGKEPVQLIKRYWRIIDESGDLQEVEGQGVIGEQPIIAPGASYQYSSGIHLHNPSGIMNGTYFMKQIKDDTILEVEIPTFSLDVPNLRKIIN